MTNRPELEARIYELLAKFEDLDSHEDDELMQLQDQLIAMSDNGDDD